MKNVTLGTVAFFFAGYAIAQGNPEKNKDEFDFHALSAGFYNLEIGMTKRKVKIALSPYVIIDSELDTGLNCDDFLYAGPSHYLLIHVWYDDKGRLLETSFGNNWSCGTTISYN